METLKMAASCVFRAVLSRTSRRSRCPGGLGSAPTGARTEPGRFRVSCSRWPFASAQVVPEAGRRAACWETASRYEEGARYRGAVWAAVAFSSFSSSDEEEKDEAQRKEEDMMSLSKKAKLSINRGNSQAASSFLHQAVALAHQTHNNQAIIYTYSQMANSAYIQGQSDSAEKLFKASMSFMSSGGTPEDDNAVIEMSSKSATIYAEQNKAESAEHGFRFCVESSEAKSEKHKESPEDMKTEEQEVSRKDTRLLSGSCLDSRARYHASASHSDQAGRDYRKASEICRQEQGETHPQTSVLMSDLATILDLQGRHDDASVSIQQAVDSSRATENPDHHVSSGNSAGISSHTGRPEDSVRFYQEASVSARQAGDQAAVEQIQEGSKEVKRRRSQESKEDNAQ